LITLVEHNYIMPVAPLIRRSVIEFVGYFDTNLNACEDWDYWSRCAAMGVRLQYREFTDARGCVRYHPGSMTTDDLRMTHARVRVRKKISALTEDRAILDLNRRYWSYDEGNYGIELIAQSHVILGELHLIRAVLMSDEAKYIFRWFLCALLAIFVRGRRFRAIAWSSWYRAIAALLRQ